MAKGESAPKRAAAKNTAVSSKSAKKTAKKVAKKKVKKAAKKTTKKSTRKKTTARSASAASAGTRKKPIPSTKKTTKSKATTTSSAKTAHTKQATPLNSKKTQLLSSLQSSKGAVSPSTESSRTALQSVQKLLPAPVSLHLLIERTARAGGVLMVLLGAILSIHFLQLGLSGQSLIASTIATSTNDGQYQETTTNHSSDPVNEETTTEESYTTVEPEPPKFDFNLKSDGQLEVKARADISQYVTLTVYAPLQTKVTTVTMDRVSDDTYVHLFPVIAWSPGEYQFLFTIDYSTYQKTESRNFKLESGDFKASYKVVAFGNSVVYEEAEIYKSDADLHCRETFLLNPDTTMDCLFGGNIFLSQDSSLSNLETILILPGAEQEQVDDSLGSQESSLVINKEEEFSDNTTETEEAENTTLESDDSLETSETIEVETETVAEEPVEDSDETELVPEPSTLPELILRHRNGLEVSDFQAFAAVVERAKSVSFYLRDAQSQKQFFVGQGREVRTDEWRYLYDTTNTPNGEYSLQAKAKTRYGEVLSDEVAITVRNVPVAEVTEESAEIIEKITTVNESLKEVEQAASPETETVTSVETTLSEAVEKKSASGETSDEQQLQEIITALREEIDLELRRLAVAYRQGDAAMIEQVENEITALIKSITSAQLPAATAQRLEERLTTEAQNIVAAYKTAIEETDRLITERQQTDVLQDSDNDGVSDYDEVTLFKTDPFSADSDSDGFTDGAEVLGGYDPLDDKRESLITYESPKVQGVVREDVLVVETVLPLTTEANNVSSEPDERQPTDTEQPTTATTTKLLIEGKALPNSFVTLYVFSTPIVVTVKTEADGSWRYEFDHELEDGEHEVYVGVTDNAGRIVAKSQPFRFIKEAQAVVSLEAATLAGGTVTPSGDDTFSSIYLLYALVSVSLVAIGLVLILLGLDLRRRRPDMLDSNQSAAQ